eukprot:5129501-Karenia_brevis.AAC.1
MTVAYELACSWIVLIHAEFFPRDVIAPAGAEPIGYVFIVPPELCVHVRNSIQRAVSVCSDHQARPPP